MTTSGGPYRGGSTPDPTKYEERVCRTCGKTFRFLIAAARSPRNPGLYCSRECIPPPVGKVEAICPLCKRPFSYYASVRKTPPRSCGWKCPSRHPTDLICAGCGKPYRRAPSEAAISKHCSRECMAPPVGKTGTTCLLCKQSFSYYASAREGIPLSCGWKCPARVTTSTTRLKKAAWKRRRREAIARDGGRCQRCGDLPPSPHVHHIIAWRISRDDSMENLVTLCQPCHAIVEGLSFADSVRCRAS